MANGLREERQPQPDSAERVEIAISALERIAHYLTDPSFHEVETAKIIAEETLFKLRTE
jgi:hypothetical protein